MELAASWNPVDIIEYQDDMIITTMGHNFCDVRDVREDVSTPEVWQEPPFVPKPSAHG